MPVAAVVERIHLAQAVLADLAAAAVAGRILLLVLLQQQTLAAAVAVAGKATRLRMLQMVAMAGPALSSCLCPQPFTQGLRLAHLP
jgi:hypothetical protein